MHLISFKVFVTIDVGDVSLLIMYSTLFVWMYEIRKVFAAVVLISKAKVMP